MARIPRDISIRAATMDADHRVIFLILYHRVCL